MYTQLIAKLAFFVIVIGLLWFCVVQSTQPALPAQENFESTDVQMLVSNDLGIDFPPIPEVK